MVGSVATLEPLAMYLGLIAIVGYAILCGCSIVFYYRKKRGALFVFLALSFLVLMMVEIGSLYFEPVLDISYYYLVDVYDWLKFGLDYMFYAQQEMWLIFQSFHFIAIAFFGLAMIFASRSRGELVKEGSK
ncbi:MAG: hypothetical protein QXS27_07750 [Candidatus Jordarchaeaceae archaeon]